MINTADYSEFGENRSTHVHARAQLRSPATAATVALTAQQGRIHTCMQWGQLSGQRRLRHTSPPLGGKMHTPLCKTRYYRKCETCRFSTWLGDVALIA